MAEFIGVFFTPGSCSPPKSDSWSPSPHSSTVTSNEFVIQVSAEKWACNSYLQINWESIRVFLDWRVFSNFLSSLFFRLAVFLVARQAAFAVVSMQHVRLKSVNDPMTVSLAFEQLSVGQGSVTSDSFTCQSVSGKMEAYDKVSRSNVVVRNWHIIGFFYTVDSNFILAVLILLFRSMVYVNIFSWVPYWCVAVWWMWQTNNLFLINVNFLGFYGSGRSSCFSSLGPNYAHYCSRNLPVGLRCFD